MVKFFYNIALIIWAAFMLPKLVWDKIAKPEKAFSFKDRFSPTFKNLDHKQKVIWLHAVSLGEIRAASVIYKALKQKHPEAVFYVSYLTKTAEKEAASLMEEAMRFLLPFDLSFIMKRLVKKIQPDLFLLVEGDFWFNLLNALKEQNIPIVVISAKLSEKSAKRYQLARLFSKKLFSMPELILTQDEIYKARFEQIVEDKNKLHITGNLKESFQDQDLESLQREEIVKRFKILEDDVIIIIGSTHEKEEDLILERLKSLFAVFPKLRLLIAPRHPERFENIRKSLIKQFGFIDVYSENNSKRAKVMLLNITGMLPACFAFSKMAIIGGSFIPDIGGHNILEPILRSSPVLFGPYMHKQREFVEKIHKTHAGIQLDPSQLGQVVLDLLQNPSLVQKLIESGEEIRREAVLPLEKTMSYLTNYL